VDDLEGQFNNETILTASKKGNNGEEGQLTVDVFQTDNEIVIKSTIAGVGADDLDISLTNDMVTIRGVRHSDERVKGDDFYHQELYWGAFSRSIILPEDIDTEGAKATLKNGLLTLRLPKLSKLRTKKIRVSS
jgi:HSP20 family protein